MAFTPGTNEKRRTEGSPRRTSLHRRTEGHGVYFCRVAAAVAGQKACGFHPEPRVSLSLSLFCARARARAFARSLSASLFPFSPTALPRISLFVPRFRSPRLTVFFSSLSPRRSLSLFFFLFPLRLFLCHRIALVRPRLAPVSLFIRHAQSPHLFLSCSTILPLPLLLPNSPEPPPSFFHRYSASPFLFDVQTDRAREQANEKIRITWRMRK